MIYFTWIRPKYSPVLIETLRARAADIPFVDHNGYLTIAVEISGKEYILETSGIFSFHSAFRNFAFDTKREDSSRLVIDHDDNLELVTTLCGRSGTVRLFAANKILAEEAIEVSQISEQADAYMMVFDYFLRSIKLPIY